MRGDAVAVTHAQLVAYGARWLRKQGFPVVWTELTAGWSREQPDVIGFRSTCSAIVEAKASRRDFLADAKKPERAGEAQGVGVYRFYLSPPDVIAPGDLPPRWGLLHLVDGKVIEVVRPLGNLWSGYGCTSAPDVWKSFQHEVNDRAERGLLFSIARRLAKGQAARPTGSDDV
jgi:hypothetical protein